MAKAKARRKHRQKKQQAGKPAAAGESSTQNFGGGPEDGYRNGSSIPVSVTFSMQMIHKALENDKGPRTAFRDPDRVLALPLKKRTICHAWATPAERGLCVSCAGFDWRYHLTHFDKSVPKGYTRARLDNNDESLKITNKSGKEYEVNQYGTRFNLPPLAVIMTTQETCTFCSLIVCTLEALATREQIDHISRDQEPVKCSFSTPFDQDVPDQWVLLVRLCSDQSQAVGGWDVVEMRFVLHDDHSRVQTDPHAQLAIRKSGRGIMNATEIESTVLRQWWKQCNRNHSKCRSADRTTFPVIGQKPAKIRVIDCTTRRVIIADPRCRYVTLSYVWGNTAGYKSKAADLVVADEDESRDQPSEYIPLIDKQLPQTIEDALEVVEMIGERYLWVDAVCIIQDDDIEKSATIQAMDQIYKSAVLTIVAAGGTHADSGLGGLREKSRNIQSLLGSVDGIGLMRYEPDAELAETPWAKRAWTYQEQELSSKMLIFAHDRVYYHCPEGSYAEARPLRKTRSILANSMKGLLAFLEYDSDQSFYQYTNHVKNYTPRTLTFETDILRAFEGILNHYLKNDGLLPVWGLPLNFLNFALGWSPRGRSHGNLKRRNRRCNYRNGSMGAPVDKGEATIPFPTWSWAGWIGAVEYEWFKYPLYDCFEMKSDYNNCELCTKITWPWKMDDLMHDESFPDHLRDIFCTGVLKFSTETAMLYYEDVREYREDISRDDCELCREGRYLINTRTLEMDDGTKWSGGKKKAMLLCYAGGFIDDFRSHIVLLLREEGGVCYREGLLKLQRKEWEKANPVMDEIQLG